MDFDDIVDGFMSIPDLLMDLPSMIGELFSGMFENITEFSYTGLVFGIFSAGLIFFLSPWLLNPFLSYMNGIEKIFWMVLTYIVCFVAGYFMGSFFENT